MANTHDNQNSISCLKQIYSKKSNVCPARGRLCLDSIPGIIGGPLNQDKSNAWKQNQEC